MESSSTPFEPYALSSASRSEKLELLTRLLGEKKRRSTRDRLTGFRPYPKQLEHFGKGSSHRERLLMAGNQLGKSYCGAYETALHLTGRYPEWWPGRRWSRPTRGWIASETAEVTRDTAQRLLLGPPEDEEQWGTGMIPADAIRGWARKTSSVANSIDTLRVRHVSGGVSVAGFKSYDQGRKKFQAATLDWVWLDEEPPMDVYQEAKTRTNVELGLVTLTFTPLLGLSEVVRMFLADGVVDAAA